MNRRRTLQAFRARGRLGRVATDIASRQAKWQSKASDQLPVLLEHLLASDVYGLREGAPRPPRQYGVYLFSERRRPRYVGRVGLTERSKRAGKRFSNFQTRLHGHTRPRHSEGTFAYSLAVRAFRRKKLPLETTRAANCEKPDFFEEFKRQCERVKRMEFRVVEINDNAVAAVFEIYAATVLGLPQSFAVS